MPRQGKGLCQGVLAREILVLPLCTEEAAQFGKLDTGQVCQADEYAFYFDSVLLLHEVLT